MEKYTEGCECMYKNRLLFDWFTLEEETGNVFLMPILKNSNLRINNCPSCGSYVRGMIINIFSLNGKSNFINRKIKR